MIHRRWAFGSRRLAAASFFLAVLTAPALSAPPAASFSMRSQYRYTAFGEKYGPGTNEGVPQRYTFAGREASANSAVGAPMFYRNRSYSPSLGRFGRRDPRLGGDSLYNAYGFPRSDALNFLDPYGFGEPAQPSGTTMPPAPQRSSQAIMNKASGLLYGAKTIFAAPPSESDTRTSSWNSEPLKRARNDLNNVADEIKDPTQKAAAQQLVADIDKFLKDRQAADAAAAAAAAAAQPAPQAAPQAEPEAQPQTEAPTRDPKVAIAKWRREAQQAGVDWFVVVNKAFVSLPKYSCLSLRADGASIPKGVTAEASGEFQLVDEYTFPTPETVTKDFMWEGRVCISKREKEELKKLGDALTVVLTDKADVTQVKGEAVEGITSNAGTETSPKR